MYLRSSTMALLASKKGTRSYLRDRHPADEHFYGSNAASSGIGS
jgi:hypothetical protein